MSSSDNLLWCTEIGRLVGQLRLGSATFMRDLGVGNITPKEKFSYKFDNYPHAIVQAMWSGHI